MVAIAFDGSATDELDQVAVDLVHWPVATSRALSRYAVSGPRRRSKFPRAADGSRPHLLPILLT